MRCAGERSWFATLVRDAALSNKGDIVTLKNSKDHEGITTTVLQGRLVEDLMKEELRRWRRWRCEGGCPG